MINIDWTLLLQAVNFLILLFILYKFLFKPVSSFLETRTKEIRKAYEEVVSTKEEASRMLEEYREKLSQSDEEVKRLREMGAKEGMEERKKIIESARDESKKLLEQAKIEIKTDILEAKKELKKEIGTMAIDIAEKVIRKSLDEDKLHEIIQEDISRVEKVK